METLLKDRKSILVVDDEKGIRYGLEKLFAREGFEVHSSEDYKDAIEIIRKNKIDIALLDIRLKGSQDGIALLKDIKKSDPGVIVIMVTGHGSIPGSVAAMQEGAADYILKPIDNNKLLTLIRKNLEIRTLREENSYLKKALIKIKGLFLLKLFANLFGKFTALYFSSTFHLPCQIISYFFI